MACYQVPQGPCPLVGDGLPAEVDLRHSPRADAPGRLRHGGQGSEELGADYLLDAVRVLPVAGLAGLVRSVWLTRVYGSPGPAEGMVRRDERGRLVLVKRRLGIPASLRHQAWPVPMGGCRPGLRKLPAGAWAYLQQREPVGVWELR